MEAMSVCLRLAVPPNASCASLRMCLPVPLVFLRVSQEAVEQASLILFGVSEKYKESANVRCDDHICVDFVDASVSVVAFMSSCVCVCVFVSAPLFSVPQVPFGA